MAAMIRPVLAALLLASATPAAAQLDQRTLAAAVARPAAHVPLPDAIFTDHRGQTIRLGSVAAERPLVLLFADYTCRHVCGPGLSLTAAALRATGLTPGRDYALVVVGLDPRDDIATAAAFATRIGDPAVAAATRLLVGNQPVVAQVRQALGYGIAYDAATDQFAHDASVYVFGTDRRLVALLPELGLRPEPLRAALSGTPPAPGLVDRVARLCYGLTAAHGRYAGVVTTALQLLAGLTVVAGGVLLWRTRGA